MPALARIFEVPIFCYSSLYSARTDGKSTGRRVGMLLGAAIIVIGTIVQATCYNLAGFMAGRFLLGFGVSICASAGPVYVSEMAHPAYRGQMTAIYNTFWYIGGIPGAFVPYGTSILEGTQAWRIPVWLQMVFSGLVIVFVMWIPESPRWLIANDRHEEALAAMAKYHGEGDPNSPIVQLEYKEMLEAISQTGSDKRWWDYVRHLNFVVNSILSVIAERARQQSRGPL